MSAGNLAQGVAYAARQAGVRCWVSMLQTAPAAKIDAVRGYGAEVVLHPDPATWFEGVEALRAQHGAVLIDAWADAGLIAGYGSIGGEILEDLPDVEVVVVPVGGGTLISGIATAIKLHRPSVRVVGVECLPGRLVHDSVAAGKPQWLKRAPSIADGLSSPTTSDLVVATCRPVRRRPRRGVGGRDPGRDAGAPPASEAPGRGRGGRGRRGAPGRPGGAPERPDRRGRAERRQRRLRAPPGRDRPGWPPRPARRSGRARPVGAAEPAASVSARRLPRGRGSPRRSGPSSGSRAPPPAAPRRRTSCECRRASPCGTSPPGRRRPPRARSRDSCG